MVAIIYSSLFVFILIISYYKFHNIFNIVSIFSFIWFFFGIISSLGVTGYRVPSLEVYMYSLVFVLIVDSILLATISKETNVNLSLIPRDSSPHNNNQSGYVHSIVILLIIPMMIKSLRILFNTHSFTEVRLAFFGGDNFASPLADLVFRQLPMGMLQGLIIYYVYRSFETKKPAYLVLALIDTLIVSFVGGGRYAIMLFVVSIIVLLLNDRSILSNVAIIKKYMRTIRIITIIVGLLLLFLSVNRGQNIVKSALGYYSGSLSFLDYILSNKYQFALNERLFGYLTFGFILEPVVLLLKVIGITTAKVPSYYFNIYCQNFYNIGDGQNIKMFNNNTTILYYFLKDFGVLGILIGAVLISFLIVFLYNNWVNNHKPLFGMMYIFMCDVLFNSLMTNQLFKSTPLFIFLVLYLCTRKKLIPIKFVMKN